MNNLNLKQLETFVAVVEWESFTKAASHLYLAQSTVSNHIQLLEESLGLTLFLRDSKRSIELTPDGRRIYQFAKDILARCAVLEENTYENNKCQIFVGASTVPSGALLPRLISQFLGTHPDCRFVVKNGDSEQIQKLLLDGKISVGFLGSADNRQDLIYERVAEDRLVMIAPNRPHYVKLHKQGCYGRELLGEPLIFRESGSGTQKVIDNYLSDIDVDERTLNVVAYVSNTETQKSLVEQGAGVAILSELLARNLLISERALYFEMDKNPIVRKIYMARCRKWALSPLATEFAQFVRESTGEQSARPAGSVFGADESARSGGL